MNGGLALEFFLTVAYLNNKGNCGHPLWWWVEKQLGRERAIQMIAEQDRVFAHFCTFLEIRVNRPLENRMGVHYRLGFFGLCLWP